MPAVQKFFKKGTVIFREGSTGNTFYFIKKGQVEISRMIGGKKKILDLLSDGETFGEFILLSEEKNARSATATIVEDAELVVIDKASLEKTLKDVPEFVFSLVNTLINKMLNLETKCFQLERRSEDFTLNSFLELLKEDEGSLGNKFPIYFKKYIPEQRQELLKVMDTLVKVCREKYSLNK